LSYFLNIKKDLKIKFFFFNAFFIYHSIFGAQELNNYHIPRNLALLSRTLSQALKCSTDNFKDDIPLTHLPYMSKNNVDNLITYLCFVADDHRKYDLLEEEKKKHYSIKQLSQLKKKIQNQYSDYHGWLDEKYISFLHTLSLFSGIQLLMNVEYLDVVHKTNMFSCLKLNVFNTIDIKKCSSDQLEFLNNIEPKELCLELQRYIIQTEEIDKKLVDFYMLLFNVKLQFQGNPKLNNGPHYSSLIQSQTRRSEYQNAFYLLRRNDYSQSLYYNNPETKTLIQRVYNTQRNKLDVLFVFKEGDFFRINITAGNIGNGSIKVNKKETLLIVPLVNGDCLINLKNSEEQECYYACEFTYNDDDEVYINTKKGDFGILNVHTKQFTPIDCLDKDIDCLDKDKKFLYIREIKANKQKDVVVFLGKKSDTGHLDGPADIFLGKNQNGVCNVFEKLNVVDLCHAAEIFFFKLAQCSRGPNIIHCISSSIYLVGQYDQMLLINVEKEPTPLKIIKYRDLHDNKGQVTFISENIAIFFNDSSSQDSVIINCYTGNMCSFDYGERFKSCINLQQYFNDWIKSFDYLHNTQVPFSLLHEIAKSKRCDDKSKFIADNSKIKSEELKRILSVISSVRDPFTLWDQMTKEKNRNFILFDMFSVPIFLWIVAVAFVLYSLN